MADAKIKPVESFEYRDCSYSKSSDGSINQSCRGVKPPLSTYHRVVSDQLKLIRFFETHSEEFKAVIRRAGTLCADVPTMLQDFRAKIGKTLIDNIYVVVMGDDFSGRSELRLFDHGNGKIDEIQVRSIRHEGKTEILDLLIQVGGKGFENLFEQLLTIGAQACLQLK